ncbi:hypothetical protein [Pontibacter indicus]|uniref:Uncharacterized protein n=1 Tax=Pontibacter indicus TaxID=1317125 RepID=A0A1R3X3U2_9BACT|nr:hypothetical protein [Pontibacter indicus]SIT84615.1 hypothetical protein SAMN05444128_1425 [Pontibacter indicus]
MQNLKNLNKYAGVFILLIISGYCVYVIFRQTYELKNNAKYTVGEIVEFSLSGHLIQKIDYKFLVDGVEYIGRENYQGGEKGKRYFVKFSSDNPDFSDFLQDMPVPDTIKDVPAEGWETIPIIKQNTNTSIANPVQP